MLVAVVSFFSFHHLNYLELYTALQMCSCVEFWTINWVIDEDLVGVHVQWATNDTFQHVYAPIHSLWGWDTKLAIYLVAFSKQLM